MTQLLWSGDGEIIFFWGYKRSEILLRLKMYLGCSSGHLLGTGISERDSASWSLPIFWIWIAVIFYNYPALLFHPIITPVNPLHSDYRSPPTALLLPHRRCSSLWNKNIRHPWLIQRRKDKGLTSQLRLFGFFFIDTFCEDGGIFALRGG